MRQWRLIYDTPAMGIYNMAIDESILESVARNTNLPTLRLYDWDPYCLSLGYGQRIADADLSRIDSRQWHIVRRPTGGKAILHGHEVTYSVTLPKDHPLTQGDVVESYRRISEALIGALELLGLCPQSEKQAKGNQGLGPVCFEVPSHYEITSNGKKLIGSAQVRRKEGILQHGSLPLSGDIAMICDALHYDTEDERIISKQRVRERATTLAEVLGKELSWQTVANAIVQGFSETFDIELIASNLTTTEAYRSQELINDIYGHPDWMNKR